jgi:hypothetical protein
MRNQRTTRRRTLSVSAAKDSLGEPEDEPVGGERLRDLDQVA